MNQNKSIDRKYYYAISQVFSPSILKKIDDYSYEENFKNLLYDSNIYPNDKAWNFIEGLELAYTHLKNNYRCEYVYKNEIANQLLLKFHNDNSATLLKELSSDNSIADVVIINGNTIAYEIKTELDSFERLPGQIESYQMLFDAIYIVTHSLAVPILQRRLPDGIGIIVLKKDGRLCTIKKASVCSDKFNQSKAVLTIRQSELMRAYEKYVDKLPKMGTSFIYNFCYQWFMNLEKEDAHAIFLESLKSRKPPPYQFELIKACLPSLKMVFLSKELSRKSCTNAIERFGIFA